MGYQLVCSVFETCFTSSVTDEKESGRLASIFALLSVKVYSFLVVFSAFFMVMY